MAKINIKNAWYQISDVLTLPAMQDLTKEQLKGLKDCEKLIRALYNNKAIK